MIDVNLGSLGLIIDDTPEYDPGVFESVADSLKDSELFVEQNTGIKDNRLRQFGDICLTQSSTYAVEVVPSTHETDAERNESRGMYRENAISQMVKQFQDDDYVHQAISMQRNETKPVYTENLYSATLNTATSYRLLSDNEEKIHFDNIDRGVALYSTGIDLDHLQTVDKQTVLDLVASSQVIFVANQRLVLSIARKFRGLYESMPQSDLIHEGYIGLIKAIARNDISRGYKFSTVASAWIFQNMAREGANKSRLIRLPLGRHDTFLRVRKSVNELLSTLNRQPTDDEISEFVGIPTSEINELMVQGSNILPSLNKPVGEDGSEFGHMIKDTSSGPDVESIIDELSGISMTEHIINAANLSDREKVILGLRYGFKRLGTDDLIVSKTDGTKLTYSQIVKSIDITKGLSLSEVGKVLGFTKQNAAQLEAKLMNKLRSVVPKTRHEL